MQHLQHLPKIDVHVIPHHKQRYNTCGDYFEKGGDTHIRISKLTANHEFLILLHELIEWYLIKQKGISIKAIDDFDMAFEKNREEGNTDEPGDDKNAPYYEEHQFATKIERLLAQKLGVNWEKYEQHVNKL